MKKALSETALAVLVCCLCGCTASRERLTAQMPEGAVRSQVLSRAFADLLGRAVAAQRKETGTMPDGARDATFLPEQHQRLEARFPGIFMVTPDEGRRFEAGRSDDAGNRKALANVVRRLAELSVPLPAMSAYLVSQHNAGSLSGAELEFALRLLSAEL